MSTVDVGDWIDKGVRSRLSQAMSENWDDDPTAHRMGRRVESAIDLPAWCWLQDMTRSEFRLARLQAMRCIALRLSSAKPKSPSGPEAHLMAMLNDQISAENGENPESLLAFMRDDGIVSI